MTALLRPLTALHLPALPETLTDTAACAEEIAQQAAAARESAAAESVRNALNRTLAEEHAPCTVTEVYLHIQSSGSIDISKVVISGNLLTGTVYLHDLLGSDVTVTKGGDALAGDP